PLEHAVGEHPELAELIPDQARTVGLEQHAVEPRVAVAEGAHADLVGTLLDVDGVEAILELLGAGVDDDRLPVIDLQLDPTAAGPGEVPELEARDLVAELVLARGDRGLGPAGRPKRR